MSLPQSEIIGVQFGVLDDDITRHVSHIRVENLNTFVKDKPQPAGLYDAHMGTIDINYDCKTCHENRRNCLGHFGLIELPYPLVNIFALKEIKKWLNITCANCGKGLIEIGVATKFAHLEEAKIADSHCRFCGTKHLLVEKTKDDDFSLQITLPGGIKQRLLPHAIKTHLGKIDMTFIARLGFVPEQHPVRYIYSTLPVLPANARTNVPPAQEMGVPIKQDITLLYKYLLSNLSKNLNATIIDPVPPTTEEAIIMSQLHYYSLTMGANTAGVKSNKKRLGAPALPTSLMRRHTGKQGRIRGSLLGKIALYTGRTVISGNPRLEIDEIGFPQQFAQVLQIAETVRPYNRERLTQHFMNGRKQYPGYSKIVRNNEEIYDATMIDMKTFVLEDGDLILRDIVDGDLTNFNRQPTLERNSINAHKVRISKNTAFKTITLNVTACPLYNADFDGDIMGTFPPHDLAARIEANYIQAVSNSFISAKRSAPVTGLIQDGVIGSYELTREGTFMDRAHLALLFGQVRRWHGNAPKLNKKHGETYAGRDVISILLRNTPINYSKDPDAYKKVFSDFIKYHESNKRVIIKDGVMEKGALDKKAIGSGANGGIIHLISNEYGPKAAQDILFNMQQVILNFMYFRGLTISPGDLLIPDKSVEDINKEVAAVILKSNEISERLMERKIVSPIGKTVHEFYEAMQQAECKVSEESFLANIFPNLDLETNNLLRMVLTRSNGSPQNLYHIRGCIGQIMINGERMKETASFRRTLPYFPRFDTSPNSYGFVTNSYVGGLDVPEYFFADMAGRFDLISKALSTGATGYQMRKSVMCMQSIIVNNLRKCIMGQRNIQPLYGNNGFDTRKMEEIEFSHIMLSDESIVEMYKTAEEKALNMEEIAQIIEDRDKFRDYFMRFESIFFRKQFKPTAYVPVDISKVISAAKNAESLVAIGGAAGGAHEGKTEKLIYRKFGGYIGGTSAARTIAMSLKDKYNRVQEFIKKLPYVYWNDIQEAVMAKYPKYFEDGLFVMIMSIRAKLCMKVLQELTPLQLEFILVTIKMRLREAMIDYGSSVGILAAQATGEPLTQYMLDSHHRSVQGGTSKSGFVRVYEIFGALPVEKEQSSSMMLRVTEDIEGDQYKVQEVANMIEMLQFKNFVTEYYILYESYDKFEHPVSIPDKEWFEEFKNFNRANPPPSNLSSWCFRFVLDHENMIIKSITLNDIIVKMRRAWPNTYITYTQENLSPLVIRIYPVSSAIKGDKTKSLTDMRNAYLNTNIRGVTNIRNTKVVKLIVSKINKDKSVIAKDIYAIETVGTNIAGVACVKKVDIRKISSSSVGDTFNMLGIDAARQKIGPEFADVMGDSAPMPTHVELFADVMTFDGKITPLDRAGLNVREATNTLLRMANGAPMQTAVEAALKRNYNPIYGVSAPLVLGNIPKIGTNYNSIVIDEEFVKENTKSFVDIMESI